MLDTESLHQLEDHVRYQALVAGAIQILVGDLVGAARFCDSGRVRAREDAVRFISSDSEEPFSFIWMCNFIDVCHEHIRKAVRDDSIRNWRTVFNSDKSNRLPDLYYVLKRAERKYDGFGLLQPDSGNGRKGVTSSGYTASNARFK